MAFVASSAGSMPGLQGPQTKIVLDGIAGGRRSAAFRPFFKFDVNGIAYPVSSLDVTLAQYGVATTIEARGPMIIDGTEPDLPAESQGNPLLPVAAYVGMSDPSGDGSSLPLTQIESGILEQLEDDRAASWTDILARSDATLFQDTYIARQMNYSMHGDQIVKLFAQTKGFHVPDGYGPPPANPRPKTFYLGAPSPNFRGLPGYTEGQYLRAMRSRSMWDEMRDAALADGFVLSLHNGVGYYGPPVEAMPAVRLEWGRDLLGCEMTHAGRRAHDITVRVDGYERGRKIHHSVKYARKHGIPQVTYSAQTNLPIAATYGVRGFGSGSSSDDLEASNRVYTFFAGTTDREQLRAIAKARYEAIVQHEFTASLELAPDPAILRLLCEVGANFAVALDGCKPSQNQTYYVREAALSMRLDENTAACSLKLTATNIPPQTNEVSS